MIVDFHTHFIPPAYLDLVKEKGNPYGRHLAELPSGDPALFGDNRLIPLLDGFHSLEAKLADIENDPHINLSYYRDSNREWVSVSGIAMISRDRSWKETTESTSFFTASARMVGP